MADGLILVAGPPCSGKNTYVEEHAAPGDQVLDWDDVREEISGLPRWASDPKWVQPTLVEFRRRERMMGSGWVIRTMPLARNRALWRRYSGGTTVVLAVAPEICIERLEGSGRPPGVQEHLRSVIHGWWRQFRPLPGETVLNHEGESFYFI